MTGDHKKLLNYIAKKDLFSVRVLLANNASMEITDIWDPEGYSPLHLAVSKNEEKIAEYLI